MLIIGERINGMYKEVGRAIANRDSIYIRKLAKDQVECGCNALDISVGPAKDNAKDLMKWLVNNVASVVDTILCIDSPFPEIIEAGIREAPGKTIINSIKNSDEHLEKIVPIAVEKDSEIICLLMTDKGIPVDPNGKIEVAVEMLEYLMEAGIDPARVYFDPILLPVKNAQKDVAETFEVMDQLRLLLSPPPNIIVGLSNLSQKARYRSLLNRTYCAMAISHGLTAVILDPFDEKLMKTVKTAQILTNRELYARSYLKNIKS